MFFNFNSIKKYDVALSFAEEDRPFVDRVARILTEKGVKVFYDDYERTRSWGEDLKHFLAKAYGQSAQFCIVFISEHYDVKQWTKYEAGVAKTFAYLNKNNKAYILPFRLDDSHSITIAPDIAYLSRATHDEQQLADRIIEKLSGQLSKRVITGWKRFSANRWRIAALATAFTGFVGLMLADRLTPVDTLTERLHQRYKRHIKGSVCVDGSFSKSHGRGTCSHHGGVSDEVDTIMYQKTWEDCKKEAEELSWLTP